jgi:hypothetical protein
VYEKLLLHRFHEILDKEKIDLKKKKIELSRKTSVHKQMQMTTTFLAAEKQ